jgi:hypothetical protein
MMCRRFVGQVRKIVPKSEMNVVHHRGISTWMDRLADVAV